MNHPDALLPVLVAMALGVFGFLTLRLLPFGIRAANRYVDRLIFIDGNFTRSLFLARLRSLFVSKRSAGHPLISSLEFLGRTAEAIELVETLMKDSRSGLETNSHVNSLINAGRYLQALELGGLDAPPMPPDPFWPLIQVNLAEAEYNLGRWDAALARLDRLRSLFTLAGIIAAGEGNQRAWILAHAGRVDEAARANEAVKLADLPPIFHAEHHFTRAVVCLAKKDPVSALAATDEALAVAKRASSLRNGAFMRAWCLSEKGDTAAALLEYERGANMTYRGQGGGALLAWGDLLLKQGRAAEARHAWTLALERDPESESAAVAKVRIANS